MTDPANSPLRAAAEAQLAATPETTPTRPVTDLLHELQVHQIELEMQNETLRNTELALAESRDRYLDLYEFAPVGYLTLSAESVIQAINLTGARLLGAERSALLQHRFAACVVPEERDVWQRRFQQIKARGEAASVELALLRGDGSLFQAQLDCVPQEVMRSGIPGGGAGGMQYPEAGTALRVSFSDISARKQAEEAVTRSDEDGKILLNTIETQIWYLTDEHTYGAVNKAHAEFNGLKIEDMAFKNMYDFFPEDIVEVCRQSNIEVFTTGKSVHSEEWMPNASGERRLISILKSPKLCVDGTVEYVVCAAEDITESKQAQEAVHNLLTRLQLLAKHLPGFVYQYQIMPDGSSVFPYASSGIEAIYGLSPEEAARDAGRVFAVLYPDDLARVGASIQHSAGTLTPWHDSYRVNHPDGRLLWVEGHSTPTRQPDGSTLWHGYIHDITKRKQADDALQLAASVFSTAREGIMITDTDGAIIDVNEAFTQITGFGRDEVIGKNPRILSSGRHDHEFYAAMWRDLKVNGHWQGEVWNRRKNGEVYAVMQTIATVPDPEGNARHYVALFSDITSLKEHQNQLEHIAHYDALTRLPNRVLLADRLHQAMAQARRRETVLAVAFLDLDGFKAINDNHGHKAGDALLIALSARMKDSLREGDTLARIGGDEFVAVLVDLSSIEDSVPMLGRLLAAAAEPVHIGELTVQVSASLGVTFYPQAEDIEADQLQRQADQAMYQAKLAGKNRYHVFDAAHDRSVRGHHESIEHIRRALVEHEFTLYYQPKVNLRSGAVVGAEALIRWQHPQKGLLTPAAFLPVIEDHPLAIDIGEWVIETALTQMETWRAAGLELPVSVNVGAHQLQQPDFVQRLHALLLAHPTFRPGDLEIEVLETSALEDIARVSMVIGACRELGVAFALDDFGTGYSSLTYLKRLAVTVLKIDQSFVHDMLEDPDDLAILEGVLGLASAFRRVAIAEGVETMEHGKMLLQLGCDLAQGYGIARPMPADQMPAWAAAWITPPAWANCQQISHDNRPLLHAAVEHRAWIVAEEHYLRGERPAPPALDPHNCRFGLWLEAERRAGRGDQPGFFAIDTLHQQIHALADELCQLRTEGRAAESVARLGELYGLCNALIGQMKALEQ